MQSTRAKDAELHISEILADSGVAATTKEDSFVAEYLTCTISKSLLGREVSEDFGPNRKN
jgi:hypothetical protein